MLWLAFAVLAACLVASVCGYLAGLDYKNHPRFVAVFWPNAFLVAGLAAALAYLAAQVAT